MLVGQQGQCSVVLMEHVWDLGASHWWGRACGGTVGLTRCVQHGMAFRLAWQSVLVRQCWCGAAGGALLTAGCWCWWHIVGHCCGLCGMVAQYWVLVLGGLAVLFVLGKPVHQGEWGMCGSVLVCTSLGAVGCCMAW
jgi:hypothetical protein